jgi:hypothetical protein
MLLSMHRKGPNVVCSLIVLLPSCVVPGRHPHVIRIVLFGRCNDDGLIHLNMDAMLSVWNFCWRLYVFGHHRLFVI